MLNKLKKILIENKYSLILSIIFMIVTIYLNNHHFALINIRKIIKYCIFEFFVFIIIFSVIKYAFYVIKEIKNKNKFYCRLLKIFIMSLVINIIFLFITWPGNWIWDEFYILNSAKWLDYLDRYHYFTVIFYTLPMMILPTAISIIAVQLVFISYSFSYCVTKISTLLKKEWLSYILIILMFIPSIIYNNLYPFRLTMYSYIELLILVWTYFKYINKESFKITELLWFTVSLVLLAIWRTEGIYYIFFVPFVYLLFRKIDKDILLKMTFTLISVLCVFLLFRYINNKNYLATFDYELSAYVNPISSMLQYDLDGNKEDYLKKIDKVLDIELMKNNPSFVEMPVYWSDKANLIKSYDKDEIEIFRSGYIEMVINNVDVFLDVRTKTFMATNGIKYKYSNLGFRDLSDSNEIANSLLNMKFAKPLNNNLRNNFLNTIRGYNQNTLSNICYQFYNIVPGCILLLIIIGVMLFKKKFILSIFLTIPLIRVPLVYITAPASYFMYYFPTYLCSSFIVLTTLVLLIDKYLKR